MKYNCGFALFLLPTCRTHLNYSYSGVTHADKSDLTPNFWAAQSETINSPLSCAVTLEESLLLCTGPPPMSSLPQPRRIRQTSQLPAGACLCFKVNILTQEASQTVLTHFLLSVCLRIFITLAAD